LVPSLFVFLKPCFGAACETLKALLHKIISARQRLRCLRSVLNTLLGPRERDVTSQLNAIADTKKFRREQVKRFFMNYRPAQVSGVPNDQAAQTSNYLEKGIVYSNILSGHHFAGIVS